MILVGFDEVETVKKDDRLYVIDPETKDIRNYINKGDKIVRKTSIDAFRNIKEQETKDICESWKMKDFYKTNSEEMQLVSKELSTNEKAFLFSIVPYISFDHNSLQIGKGKKAVDVGTEDLVEITGMSRSIVYSTINSLVDKDIIFRGKNSRNMQYYVNPWLFCKGNRINKVLKNMFKNYKIRSQGGVAWKDFDDKLLVGD